MRYYVAGEGSCWTPTSSTRARARIFRPASRESGPKRISFALSSGPSLLGIAEPNKSLGRTSRCRAMESRLGLVSDSSHRLWYLAAEPAKCPGNGKTDSKYDEEQYGHRSLPSGS